MLFFFFQQETERYKKKHNHLASKTTGYFKLKDWFTSNVNSVMSSVSAGVLCHVHVRSCSGRFEWNHVIRLWLCPHQGCRVVLLARRLWSSVEISVLLPVLAQVWGDCSSICLWERTDNITGSKSLQWSQKSRAFWKKSISEDTAASLDHSLLCFGEALKVWPKMTILPLSTHPYVVPDL